MYRHFNSQLPEAFTGYFAKQNSYHNYHTRNPENYNVTKTKTKFACKSVRNSGPTRWNSLQKSVKHSKTITIFRSQIKKSFILKYI